LETHQTQHSREEFDRLAFLYDPFVRFVGLFVGGEGKLRRRIVEFLNPKSGEKILDVCCGTGTVSVLCAQRVGSKGEVLGVDFSLGMLRKARQKLPQAGSIKNLHLQHGRAESLALKSEVFDKVVMVFALHEMPSDMRLGVLTEVHRVLKPGGTFVAVDYYLPSERWVRALFKLYMTVEGDIAWDFIRSNLPLLLHRAGFEVIREELWLRGILQAVRAIKEPHE